MPTVQPKDPAKPGYMSTEFWATVGVIGFALLEKFGFSKEQVMESADNWVQSLANLIQGGSGSIALIVIGFLVWGYQKRRAEIKRTKIIAATKMK